MWVLTAAIFYCVETSECGKGTRGSADSREVLKQVFYFKGLRGRNRRKNEGVNCAWDEGLAGCGECCIVWPCGGSSYTDWRTLAHFLYTDALSSLSHYGTQISWPSPQNHAPSRKYDEWQEETQYPARRKVCFPTTNRNSTRTFLVLNTCLQSKKSDSENGIAFLHF